MDGESVIGYVTAGAASVEFRAVDEAAGLRLTLVVALLPSGLVRVRAAVTNLADGALRARRPHPRPPGARRRRRAARLRGSAQPGAGAAAQRRSAPGCTCGRTAGAAPAPTARYVLHAGPPGFGFAAGEVYAVHTAWSGNHVHYAERACTGERVLGGGELLLPGEVRLGPRRDATRARGSTARTATGWTRSPAASTATCGRGRGRSRPTRPVTLNVWEAVYFDHDLDRLLDLADRAAAVGRRALRARRRLVRRAAATTARASATGWCRAEVWPDGLHPLVDRVRELGMQFGLWFEPEMVNPDSDVARAHPEWIMSARPTSGRSSPAHQQVLDLGIPEAYEHVKGQIAGAARRVRHRLHQVGPQPRPHRGGHADRRRPARRARARPWPFYRLLDELRAAHPGPGDRVLLLRRRAGSTSACWSAPTGSGCRTASTRSTGSGCCAGPRSWSRPEYLGSHIASGRSHTTGRRHDLGFRAAHGDLRPPGHRVGPRPGLRRRDRRAGGLDRVLQGAARVPAHAATWCAMDGTAGADPPARRGRAGPVAGAVRVRARRQPVPRPGAAPAVPRPRPGADLPGAARHRRLGAVGLRPPRWWGGPGSPGASFTGAALEHVGVAAPIVHPDQVVLLEVLRE